MAAEADGERDAGPEIAFLEAEVAGNGVRAGFAGRPGSSVGAEFKRRRDIGRDRTGRMAKCESHGPETGRHFVHDPADRLSGFVVPLQPADRYWGGSSGQQSPEEGSGGADRDSGQYAGVKSTVRRAGGFRRDAGADGGNNSGKF